MLNAVRQHMAGFTLIEVLVTVSIFVALVSSIVAVFLNTTKFKDVIFEQLITQGDARTAVQRFINEVRRANYSSIGAYPIQTAGTSTFIFYSDIDSDSLRERVRYFLSGRDLKKGIIKPTGTPLGYPADREVIVTVASNITNTSSLFYYYDQSYSGSSQPLAPPVENSAVRMVEIYLQLEKDLKKSPKPLVVQAKTEIRNLKDS